MSTSEFVLIKLQVYIVQTVTLLQPNSPQALFRICSEKRYSELSHSSFPKNVAGLQCIGLQVLDKNFLTRDYYYLNDNYYILMPSGLQLY